MSIVRDIGQLVLGTDGAYAVVTCSTANQTLASTVNVIQSSAAYLNNPTTASAGTGIVGRIVDRLNDIASYDRYTVVMPGATLFASRGSTVADGKLVLGVKLQHGNSSGGGDMVDYSTGSIQPDTVFFTTALTTSLACWTTAPFYRASPPCYFDIRAANRYIREVISVSIDAATTASQGFESLSVLGTMEFFGGAQLLNQVPWQGAGSTSTSTQGLS